MRAVAVMMDERVVRMRHRAPPCVADQQLALNRRAKIRRERSASRRVRRLTNAAEGRGAVQESS